MSTTIRHLGTVPIGTVPIGALLALTFSEGQSPSGQSRSNPEGSQC